MKKYTKKLITLNEFVAMIQKKKISDKEKISAINEYFEFLESKPKRTDFINFDDDGFCLFDNNPLFRGFITCDEASSEEKKVALKDNVRIYFFEDKDKDVVLYHTDFITDECTYNEIAIGFNTKNNTKPLVFS